MVDVIMPGDSNNNVTQACEGILADIDCTFGVVDKVRLAVT